MRRSSLRFLRDRRGQDILEYTVVLPIFLMVVVLGLYLGLVDAVLQQILRLLIG